MINELSNTLRSIGETRPSTMAARQASEDPRRLPLATLHSSLVTLRSPLDLLKITQLDDEKGRKVLQVKAGWNQIAADYDDIVSEYADIHMPGFRPGKVPRRVIEQRLQKQIIDDLSHRAAQRLGREALRETGEECAGPMEIGDIDCGKGKPFQFTVRYHHAGNRENDGEPQ